MKHIYKFVAIPLIATLVGCTTGATTAPNLTMANPFAGKLQFAVGTANIYGNPVAALNVVSTFRQPNGTSAVGEDTPSLTGPFTDSNAAQPADGVNLPDPYTTMFFYSGAPSLGAGPSLPETTAGSLISGTSQLVHPGTPFCDTSGPPPAGFTQCPAGISPNTSTFGQSGGVFAMGLAPYNIVANTSQSYSYQPYPQPIYDSGATHQTFVPWGGPPAFDPDGNGMGTRDGLIILGNDSFAYGLCNALNSPNVGCPFFLGVGEGITVFEGVAPHAGAYSLAVQIGIIGNNGSKQVSTIKATANLASLAVLGNATAPVVTPDGTGGATFNATLPAGATEALVQIVDYGPGAGPTAFAGGGSYHAANCQGPKGTNFAPVYYTIVVTSSGPNALGANNGPNNLAHGAGSLTPTPSICTAAQNSAVVGAGTAGDNISVQMIGFDYPAYEAAHSLLLGSVPQSPQLTGPNGQADITISVGEEEDAPGYAQTPLAVSRRPALRTQGFRRFGAPIQPAGILRKLGIPAQI